jgi:hypothetical protein
MDRMRRGSRLVAETVVGYVLVAAGVVMLVTPGPGIVAIVAGLAVLARHYHWADRLARAVRARIRDTATEIRARRTARRLAAVPAPDDVPASGQPLDEGPDRREEPPSAGSSASTAA